MIIDDDLVAALLREHYVPQPDPDDEECSELGLVAEASSGCADDERLHSARRHLASCDRCRAASVTLSALLVTNISRAVQREATALGHHRRQC